MNNLQQWTDLRLRQTRAYLENCIKSGHPGIYDSEEDRLKLLDVQAEITRREAEGAK